MEVYALINTRRRFVIALLAASLGWMLAVPLIGATPCGLRIPHEHLFLGRVDQSEVNEHLAQEAACTVSTNRLTATRQSGILSYVPTHSLTLSMVMVIMWVPALLVAVIAISREDQRLMLRSRFPAGRVVAPLAPPPRWLLTPSIQ